MENILVYCELEENVVSDISLELLSKGRKLADNLGCKLEAVLIGNNLSKIPEKIFPYGTDTIYIADDSRLSPYSTMPHTAILVDVIKKEKPQIVLVGATSVGRDLGPRVSARLRVGLTADCTNLVIGDYTDNKTGKEYKNLLYQIRPAFGGNIIATIVNPDTRPQMATVREGVMKQEITSNSYKGKINKIDVNSILSKSDILVDIIERHIEPRKINLAGAQIIIAGGFGVGSKENFALLKEFADLIGGELGASRAAVDSGYVEHERQVGQTGITVRPKLYFAIGISGAIQHTAGMDKSAQIISINSDPDAPIHKIADYAIIGNFNDVVPKMIKFYKEQSK